MLENYPVTTGIMPWVFKRPWPTAAIQLVDGFGNPEAQYYAVKRAYAPIHPYIAIEHLNFKAGETVKLPIKLWSDNDSVTGTVVTEIFDPNFNKVFEVAKEVLSSSKYTSDIGYFEYEIPHNYCDCFFFIRVRFVSDGVTLGESFYTPKVLSCMVDDEK